MANSLSLITFITIFKLLCTCLVYTNGCYTSIISFGDSLADTAEGLGLPLVQPFVGHTIELRQGANFAVAGATALDSSFLGAIGVRNPMTNSSLQVQLGWFRRSLLSLCDIIQDCKRIIGHSLVLMGEIGGNDYNHSILAGKSLNEVETYVPLVIEAIISAVNELIELGAKTLLIPGNLPIGCLPVYLTKYYGSGDVEYDNITGCITQLNELAEYHNELLKMELSKMRDSYPEVNIIYADYYNAAMQFFRSPNKYGFINGALKACCGGRGPYKYNISTPCADVSSTVCVQPHTYANWDGLHLTEAAYKVIFTSIFQGPYAIPRFDSVCPTKILQEIGGISST